MAKTIDVGGRKVTLLSSLDPASPPDDLRAGSAGTRPNSFGDAASNAQVKTPAPQLRLPAPEVSKPLFGPHDPVYHGDGRYGAPPNPGATNAAAGASQTAAEANNPRQSGSQPASQPRGGAGTVPPTAVGTPTSLAGKAGQFLASDSGGAALAAGAQALAEVPNLRKVFGSDQTTNLDKSTQLYEGIARTANVGASAALGTKLGMMAGTPLAPFTGGLSIPVLGALGGVGGGLYGNYATNKAIEAGRALVGTDTASPAERIPTSAPAAQPTLRQDPLRVQEARNSIVDPGRASVPMPAGPKQLRFGMESPAGTFAEGYTDMGKGIARKGNEYTNIGANGQPTAVSGTDSRTPDQIANGDRIRAETAKTVAEAGGLSNLIRNNNNLRAQIMDRDVMGGSGIMGSGMRGNMRINDNGGGSIADKVKELKSAGIKVSHNTLRQMMQSDTQLRTNAATNATSRATNAATNATSRANNQDTNDTSRANNQDTTAASRYGADAPGRLAAQQLQRQRDIMQQAIAASTDQGGNVDRTKLQQILADNGATAAADAQGNLIRNVQTQGAKANEIKSANAEEFGKLFAGQAMQESKDGTPERNKDIEAAQAAEALRRNPNIINAPREAQSAYAVQAAADRGLRLKINEGNEGGWESWMPTKLLGRQRGQESFQSLPEQSWWEGAKLSDQVGGLRGALSPNLERGDRYITLKDGSTLNLGQMTEEQIARVGQLTGQAKSK
jgi:hypothetical protein